MRTSPTTLMPGAHRRQPVITVTKHLGCQRCGAPLRVHRFGLSARCDYCCATALIADTAVDVAGFRASLASQKAQQAACMAELARAHAVDRTGVARGTEAYAGVEAGVGSSGDAGNATGYAVYGRSVITATWQACAAYTVQWPTARCLLLQPASALGRGAWHARVTSWQVAAAQACAQQRPYFPALPIVFEHGTAFTALQNPWGAGLALPTVATRGLRLRPEQFVWMIARMRELWAWLAQLDMGATQVHIDDVLVSYTQHELLLLAPLVSLAEVCPAALAADLHALAVTLLPSDANDLEESFTAALAVWRHAGAAPVAQRLTLYREGLARLQQWTERHRSHRYAPLWLVFPDACAGFG